MEPLVIFKVVYNQSGSRAPMFSHAEEDVDARSKPAGCCLLILEVRDRFSSYCFLLVVQVKDYLVGFLGVFNWGIS